MTDNNGRITLSWTRPAKADTYNLRIYPTGTDCSNPYNQCRTNYTGQSISFVVDPRAGSNWTIEVQPVNNTCGVEPGGWCTSEFLVNARFWVDFYKQSDTATAMCVSAGPLSPGIGASIKMTGGGNTYHGVITGYSAYIDVPYHSAKTGNTVTLTPGQIPGKTYNYSCDLDCHSRCRYFNVSFPYNRKFYLSEVDLSNAGWWQVSGGHVYAAANTGKAILSDIPKSALCLSPTCITALIMADVTGRKNSAGIPVSGGGSIKVGGWYTQREKNSFAIGTSSHIREIYEYFARSYGMSLVTPGFPSSTSDAEKPPSLAEDDKPYLIDGDLTIDSYQWQVKSDEEIVIFVEGNLEIRDSMGAQQLITVEEGGFLAFIVSGDITIDPSVGNDDLDDATPNIEGVFVANGELTIESRGTGAGGDDRFVGAGTFVGWSGVNLNRNFSDGGLRKTENNYRPTELFIYRPDFVVNIPEKMKRTHYLWQETN